MHVLTLLWCVWQAGSSSDSEEEELLPMKRPAQQRSKRIEEEEEEEEDDLLVKPVGRQAKKARTSGAALLPLLTSFILLLEVFTDITLITRLKTD